MRPRPLYIQDTYIYIYDPPKFKMKIFQAKMNLFQAALIYKQQQWNPFIEA